MRKALLVLLFCVASCGFVSQAQAQWYQVGSGTGPAVNGTNFNYNQASVLPDCGFGQQYVCDPDWTWHAHNLTFTGTPVIGASMVQNCMQVRDGQNYEVDACAESDYNRFISWALVAVLSLVIILQYHGASKAEQQAAQAEVHAKDLESELQQFKAVSEIREQKAEARYQASQAESAYLREILAKGSQVKPQNAPQKPLETILATPQPAKGVDSQQATQAPQSACYPFIYQGSQLVISDFQVLVCDQQPVVQAEAAVALRDEKALVDKLNVQIADATAQLALAQQALEGYKKAEIQWKGAAKKSRIKKVLGVAEKIGLFAAGVYLGHRF